MEKFSWKNGLLIIAAVVLNCVICGALMKPLDAPKGKPRSKNFFDRLIEKHFRKGRSQSEVSENMQKHADMLHAVQV